MAAGKPFQRKADYKALKKIIILKEKHLYLFLYFLQLELLYYEIKIEILSAKIVCFIIS